MAIVYRATDTVLQRAVALKVLADSAAGGNLEERFLREARLCAAVRHPSVVQVLDFGKSDGAPFMVMEMLRGESLDERLERQPPLALTEVIEIVTHALEGLSAVHEAGIVHRDLKPSNVFLAEEGGRTRPKLIDFGISRDVERASPSITREGNLVGTPHYMSPEQARGLRDVDLRTDVYSMGVVLYEALTGQLPFESENVGDILVQVVVGTPPPVNHLRPDLGWELAEVVERAMAKDREERYPTAAELRSALLAVTRTTPLSAPPILLTRKPRSIAPPIRQPVRSQAPTIDGGPRGRRDTAPYPRRSVLLMLAAALAIVALAAPVAWMAASASAPAAALARLSSQTEPPSTAEPARPASEAAPPVTTAEPDAPAEPHGPAEPQWIEIALDGVPEGASVSIDGARTSLPLRAPRDERDHRIDVVAPGHVPWSVVHHGSAGGRYAVALQPSSAAPSRSRASRRRTARTAAGHSDEQGGADRFRELDY